MSGQVEERVLQLPLIKFLTGNIRGLYPRCNQNKVPLLQEIANNDKLALLALTETHLHRDILDAEVKIQNYEIFRTDRRDRSHGGVAIYIDKNLAASTDILIDFSNGTNEILALFIKKLNLEVIVVYRPPNTTQDLFKDIIDRINYILEHLPSPDTEVFLLGDFNFPHVNWESLDVTGGTADEKQQARDLMALMETKYLTQFVKEPTRGSNILDLILSNNHGIIHKYELAETAMSDHKLCEVTAYINEPTIKHPQQGCKLL